VDGKEGEWKKRKEGRRKKDIPPPLAEAIDPPLA